MVDVAQLVEPRIVIPAVAGSSPVVHPTFGVWFVEWFIGPLAQLVEQLTLNQLVVGSIPTRPTIFSSTSELWSSTPLQHPLHPSNRRFRALAAQVRPQRSVLLP
jgi:hypothetical protein